MSGATIALDLTPPHGEQLARQSSRIFPTGCPGSPDRLHLVGPRELARVVDHGGEVRCCQCGMAKRVPQRERLDVALNLVDNARRWAGLPRLTGLERHFLQKVLSSNDVINEALHETGMLYPRQEEQPPDPEPMTVAEKVGELVNRNPDEDLHEFVDEVLADAGPRDCERRQLPPDPPLCDGGPDDEEYA